MNTGPSIQRGVSLLELMIGLAIIGLLTGMALPSYKAWLQNTQIRNAAEATRNGLQLARAEAVRTNQRVRFTLGTASDWTVQFDISGATIQSRPSGEGSRNVTVAATPTGATTLTFNGLGRVVANGDGSASASQLDFTVPTIILPSSDARNLRVTVDNPGGQIRMCDPNLTIAGDPRGC